MPSGVQESGLHMRMRIHLVHSALILGGRFPQRTLIRSVFAGAGPEGSGLDRWRVRWSLGFKVTAGARAEYTSVVHRLIFSDAEDH